MSTTHPQLHITVATDDFDLQAIYNNLATVNRSVGAVVTFSGLVRDTNLGDTITKLQLEHYPGMTEKVLTNIALDAHRQWPCYGITIYHRVGLLEPCDQIVAIGVASAHRGDAFKACEFMMDFLKTRAPFWKKEITADNQSRWLESRETDERAAERWRIDKNNV